MIVAAVSLTASQTHKKMTANRALNHARHTTSNIEVSKRQFSGLYREVIHFWLLYVSVCELLLMCFIYNYRARGPPPHAAVISS